MNELTDIRILIGFFDGFLNDEIDELTNENQRTSLAARNSFRICSTDLFPKAISVDRALARI